MIVQILKQQRVLLCRPEAAGKEMAAAIDSVGGKCLSFPCIDIKEIALTESGKSFVMNLDQYDHVIVVSQHAADLALKHIDHYWPQLPAQQRWHAIGRKTAQILLSNDVACDAPVGDMDSEQLLSKADLEELDDQKVLLLKGHEGRTVIAQELTKRGAKVDQLELYKRTKPTYSVSEIKEALVNFEPQILIALSAETLVNLHQFANQIGVNLLDRHLIVSSKRVAGIARDLGFHLTYVPDNLKAIDIIRCIARIKAS